MTEPIISEKFDMNDIRAIRDYNSLRHIEMSHEEIIEDIKKEAEEMLNRMNKSKKAVV